MKRFGGLVLLVAAIGLVSACSKGSGDSGTSGASATSGIEVSLDGKSATFKPVESVLLTSNVTDAVMHTIVLSNYELKKPATKMTMHKSAKGEGQMRIQFSIVGEKGTDENTPLKIGEYKTNPGNSGSPFGATTDGRYYFAESGSENSRGLNGPDIKEGKVLITSVENGVVKGSVDITDGTLAIKGDFTSNVG